MGHDRDLSSELIRLRMFHERLLCLILVANFSVVVRRSLAEVAAEHPISFIQTVTGAAGEGSITLCRIEHSVDRSLRSRQVGYATAASSLGIKKDCS